MTSAFKPKNVTFRTYEVYADIVERAAEKAGQNVSEWCRERVPEMAAKELGVALPPLPDMKRGRFNDLVERAAKLTGLSPEEFMRQAGERMAAAALGFSVPAAPESSPTPIHPKLNPREKRDTPVPRARRRA